jgi:hypothetical protein
MVDVRPLRETSSDGAAQFAYSFISKSIGPRAFANVAAGDATKISPFPHTDPAAPYLNPLERHG